MYRPIRTLGAGGMAKVTLAVDETSGAHVVLKRTLSGSAQDEKRLRVEGNLGRRLKHKAIVRTLDVYDDDNGSPVVVLEYVPGLSMSALRGAGPLSPQLCAVVGKHVAEALHAIHTAVDEVGRPMQMLHRDVTPANVLVDLEGQAKLIDLGIARAAGANLTLTATGEVRGTLRYLAPELFQGDKQTTTTDLWALGIVILEAALGEPLHKGSTAEVIARILKQSPLTRNILDRVEPALAEILATLLSIDPAGREADASVIARAFARVANFSGGDERALAAHVRAVVDDKSGPTPDAPEPDDESWSSLLDARAHLGDEATRDTSSRAIAHDSPTRLARGRAGSAMSDGSAPRRANLIVGVAAGITASLIAAVAAIVILPGAGADVAAPASLAGARNDAPSTGSMPAAPPGATQPTPPTQPTQPVPVPMPVPVPTSPSQSAPSLNPDRLEAMPPAPSAPTHVVLPYGSTWRYHDRGTDPGKRWNDVTFKDRAWPSGKAKLGYGGDGEVTVLSYGPDEKRKHAAAYFRTTFDVSRSMFALAKKSNVLVATMIHDDGVALYLNGVEILRSGLPPGATHRDWALQVVQRGRGELKGQVFRLPARALKPGKNVLAAEVHQADATSTDLAFELQLAIEE